MATSASGDHLDVVWGEINKFIKTSRYPLDAERGGPLIVNHQHLRKVYTDGPKRGEMCPISYVKSQVAKADTIAAMGGHHAGGTPSNPRTLFVADECSHVPTMYYKTAIPWANRVLAIGNAWQTTNFFYDAIKAGDVPYEERESSGVIVGS